MSVSAKKRDKIELAENMRDKKAYIFRNTRTNKTVCCRRSELCRYFEINPNVLNKLFQKNKVASVKGWEVVYCYNLALDKHLML